MDLLGEIVRNAIGMGNDEFAAIHLYTPLDIDPTKWQAFDNGVIDDAGSLYQTPREIMKFSVTYLNNGVWNGQQIIPEDWVALSSVPYHKNTGVRVPCVDGGCEGYGYTWWQYDTLYNGKKLHAYFALGWGGLISS
jgi:CubicO group peptidase (beta-lactamase class C family)